MADSDVKLRPVKCPSCGGSIEFPIGRNRATCNFCGNEVLVDEAGWLGQMDEFEMKMKNAMCALENKEWDHALRLFESCRDINETDARCFRGIIESRTRKLTAGFDKETESIYRCYINRVGPQGDPEFAESYKGYLRKVADNDAATAKANARQNIEYFERVIESKKERIQDQEKSIQEIKAKPSDETAEKKYGTAKAGFALSTVMLFLAPVITVGLIVLAFVLLIRSFAGTVYLGGIIASFTGALIFAGITRYVWKHYRNSIQIIKRRRVAKLQEDHVNDEREKSKAQQTSSRTSDIEQTSKDIEELKQAIVQQNEYLAIDRTLRLAYFEKMHFDAAGISNSIEIDPAIQRFIELERNINKSLKPGYKMLTKVNPSRS